jgi:hypothetical protein
MEKRCLNESACSLTSYALVSDNRKGFWPFLSFQNGLNQLLSCQRGRNSVRKCSSTLEGVSAKTFEVFDSFLVFDARTDLYTVLTSQIVSQSSKTFGSAILCRQTHPATSLPRKFSLWICNAADGLCHSRGPRKGSTSAITLSLLLMILQTQQEYLSQHPHPKHSLQLAKKRNLAFQDSQARVVGQLSIQVGELA